MGAHGYERLRERVFNAAEPVGVGEVDFSLVGRTECCFRCK